MTRPDPATTRTSSPETEVGSVFVSNYPPYSFWSRERLPEVLATLQAPPRPDTDLGLYLHIPFCRKRCKFCYFRVYTEKSSDEIGRYVEALAREVEILASLPAVAGRRPTFVYFGGGTPSYISVRHLEGLVERVRAALTWDNVREVTFECEPGTLTQSKLDAIRGIGVTRLSLGVESFDDGVLRENGRAHVSKEIYRAWPWIEARGFEQVNIDLIAGMVGETWETWRETVRRTLELAPDSVTIYQLELPHNAVYSRQVQEGELTVPLADWATKRAWHGYAFEELAQAGYEISSAYTMVRGGQGERRGQRQSFVYRDSVWHGVDLLGTGVASFSHMSGVHYQSSAGWDDYLSSLEAGILPLERGFVTTPEERLTRELLLQMKLGRIRAEPFQSKFGINVLQRFRPAFQSLEREGMLEILPDGIRLTRQGLLQVDRLLPELYEERYRGARYT